MKYSSIDVLFTAAILAIGSLAHADEDSTSMTWSQTTAVVREKAIEVGHATKEAAITVGHKTKEVATTVGHRTRDAAKAIGHHTAEAAKVVGHEAKKGAIEVKDAVAGEKPK
jgi:hypothetical protein